MFLSFKLRDFINQKKEVLKIAGIAPLFIGAFIAFYIGFKTDKTIIKIKPSPSPSPTEKSFPSPEVKSSFTEPNPETPKPSKSQTKTIIKALQNVTFDGHDISYSVSFPAEGGTVTIETGLGICYGSGIGTFEGGDSTAVSGTLTGTCDYYSDILNATGTFSGNIYVKEDKAEGTWEGSANGHSKSGTWSFTFNPVD